MQDYRKRCYQNYVTTLWEIAHSFSKEEYDFLFRVYRKRFKTILPEDKKSRIIDIACGSGHFLYFLQKEGYMNTRGIDFSEEQLAKAQNAGVKHREKADLFEFLPRHAGSFDLITANDIIEHLKKDEVLDFLDLIFYSLAPGGQILISTLNAQSLLGARGIFIDFTHEQGFTPESLTQVMRVCNFEDVAIFGERPIIHDFRSALRAGLWWVLVQILRAYSIIEQGTGRRMMKFYHIFEPRIYAVGRKPR
jgi:SAM-dependent methyltransferase